ncbi:MAG: DNA-binding NarL/FixJ family response regulator [Alphaproteobacteria bacterium]|jgi:DNA-binding NarL/FixJ family response regulator
MDKFLIADDHPLFREALKSALQTAFAGVNYLESDSFTTTINSLRRQRTVSLLLLDLNMPGCDNYYGLLKIRQTFPNLPIAVVSASDDLETIAESMEFGANAFIPKTTATSEMVTALKIVLSGGSWVPPSIRDAIKEVSSEKVEIAEKVSELTTKQFMVLRLVKKGLMNKEIAAQLNVTEATVKAHVSMLFKRLGVKSRTQILVVIEKLKLE